MATVTDYQFAIGNGVLDDFTVMDPDGEAAVNPVISALYRTDWQGKITLSPDERTNKSKNSVFAGGAAAPTTWWQDNGTGTSAPVASIYQTGDSAVAYLQTGVAQQPYFRPFSAAITIDPNTTNCWSTLIESVSGNVKANQVLAFASTPAGSTVVYPPCSANPGGGTSGNIIPGVLLAHIVVGATGSSSIQTRIGLGASSATTGSVQFSRPQFNVGTERGSWIPTTSAPVALTDYVLTGSALALGEVPAVGALLSWSGTDDNPLSSKHVVGMPANMGTLMGRM